MKKTKILAAVTIVLFLAVSVLVVRYGMLRYREISYPRTYSELVAEASEKYGVEEAVIYAVIRTESNFDPQAISHAGAIGLMQIMPDTFHWIRFVTGADDSYTEADLTNPAVSIDYGTCLLSILLEEYGSLPVAAAAYNAGRGNVQGWLEDPAYSSDGITLSSIPFKETREYVEKISSAAEMYKKIYYSQSN